VAAAVARLDGAPAAAALVYVEGAGAVVAWVATAPEARRRGLGRFVTAAVTNRGLDLGAAWVTLQASDMGAPLYRAMGYRDVSMSRVWLAPSPQP
jgi:GNAT superfamily N-acetyltransferase